VQLISVWDTLNEANINVGWKVGSTVGLSDGSIVGDAEGVKLG